MQVKIEVMFVDLLVVGNLIMYWSLLIKINVMENIIFLSVVFLGSFSEKIFLGNIMKFREL